MRCLRAYGCISLEAVSLVLCHDRPPHQPYGSLSQRRKLLQELLVRTPERGNQFMPLSDFMQFRFAQHLYCALIPMFGPERGSPVRFNAANCLRHGQASR